MVVFNGLNNIELFFKTDNRAWSYFGWCRL